MNAWHPVIERLEADEENLKAHWSLPREEARFLYLLARMSHARQSLEVGTSIGYSTLHLALAASRQNGHVISIDASQERQSQAQAHLEQAGLAEHVTLMHGDARQTLQALQVENVLFDLAFLDARKSEYHAYLELIEPMLCIGGLLIADNTRSHRQQMERFIEAITHSIQWETCDLETPHGLILARKTQALPPIA